MNRITLFVLLLAFATFQEANAAEVMKVEEKSFDMPAGGSVTLIGDEGSVSVKSWSKNQVHLRMVKTVWERDEELAEKLMEELYVKIDHYRDQLYIKQVDLSDQSGFRFGHLFDSDRWHRRGYQIDFELTVPENINLRVENDEGDVEVVDISGSLNVQVDEGNLRLRNIASSEIKLSVDEGGIECSEISGGDSRFDLAVDEGNIRLQNCTLGDMQLRSDEGDIVLQQVKARNCRITGDEADIEMELDLAPDGLCRIQTDEGNIFIFLSDESNLALELSSSDGRVESDFPLKAQRWRDDGERLEGVLGRDLSKLTASTDEGSVYLKKR